MTKEYIIRDEMIEQTKARIVLGAPKFNTGLEAAIEVATSIPAADVVEVQHGRWHRFMKGSGQSGNTLILSDAFQCTVCKESVWNKSDYCPNCGAKMDGGQDGG